MDNSGQGLSISTVVIIAMAIIVLLMVATFFSGSFSEMGKKLHDFSTEATGDQAELDAQAGYAKCITTCLEYSANQLSWQNVTDLGCDGSCTQ